jgi:hypothetical protein
VPDARPRDAGRRGPVARQPELKPTGFRIDERTRFELKAAELFTNSPTLQAVIDLAVRRFLAELRDTPGFVDALHNAERALQVQLGVTDIRGLRATDDDG